MPPTTNHHQPNNQPNNQPNKPPNNQHRELLAEVAAAQDDPLPAWLRYVKWTQEAFPTAAARGKERLLEALEAATKALAGCERYYGDPRFLRLWVQYVSRLILLDDLRWCWWWLFGVRLMMMAAVSFPSTNNDDNNYQRPGRMKKKRAGRLPPRPE